MRRNSSFHASMKVFNFFSSECVGEKRADFPEQKTEIAQFSPPHLPNGGCGDAVGSFDAVDESDFEDGSESESEKSEALGNFFSVPVISSTAGRDRLPLESVLYVRQRPREHGRSDCPLAGFRGVTKNPQKSLDNAGHFCRSRCRAAGDFTENAFCRSSGSGHLLLGGKLTEETDFRNRVKVVQYS